VPALAARAKEESARTPRPTAAPARATAALPRVKSFSLNDAAGRTHTPAEWKKRKAVVLIFLGTECPVSNGYAPEMSRLARAYGTRGVLLWGVHPDPDVSAAVAARHARTYRLDFPVLLDPEQRLAGQTGVRVVPEAVVLSADGQVLYRGRIDDKYALDGKRRDEPRTRDLRQALEAVLAGRAVPVPRTPAFGCPLPDVAKGR
jgi:peroxiredoxin